MLQKSITPLVASIAPDLTIGGPNPRRKIGYRKKNFTPEGYVKCRIRGVQYRSFSLNHADRVIMSEFP
jgi:hypothetical protein